MEIVSNSPADLPTVDQSANLISFHARLKIERCADDWLRGRCRQLIFQATPLSETAALGMHLRYKEPENKARAIKEWLDGNIEWGRWEVTWLRQQPQEQMERLEHWLREEILSIERNLEDLSGDRASDPGWEKAVSCTFERCELLCCAINLYFFVASSECVQTAWEDLYQSGRDFRRLMHGTKADGITSELLERGADCQPWAWWLPTYWLCQESQEID